MAWSLPVRGGYVTSGFGPRSTSIPGASTYHQGVDLAGGDHIVRAAGDGIVQATGWNSVRGWCVVVRHDDGTVTTYQHLASVDVKAGQRVPGGSRLGVMGSTGTASSGAHLHLEAFPAGRFLVTGSLAWSSPGRAVDPEPYLRARGVDLRAGLVGNVVSTPTLPDVTLPDVPILTQPIMEALIMAGAQLSDFLGLLRCEETGAVVAVIRATGKVKSVTPSAYQTIRNSGLAGEVFLDDGAGNDLDHMDAGPFNALVGLLS